MRSRLLVPLATLALLAGCGAEEPAPAASPPPSAEASASETPSAPVDGDGPTEEFTGYERVTAHTGDTIEMVLPPSGWSDSEAPSEVAVTFGKANVEPSTNTRGNVYVKVDAEVRNTGDGPADTQSLNWTWQGEDGLLESDIGVFCDEELEPNLPVGARTEGCFMVDVPKEPGVLTLETMDKTVTLELTSDLINS